MVATLLLSEPTALIQLIQPYSMLNQCFVSVGIIILLCIFYFSTKMYIVSSRSPLFQQMVDISIRLFVITPFLLL